MRKNKRIRKRSRFATSSMGVASLIVSGLIMMMIFFAMNAKCSTITREIGVKERELKTLEAELTREKTRWDGMKVPERLNIALARFGLEMAVPREDQIVRMGRHGAPMPGQIAVARMRGASSTPTGTAVARVQTRRRASAISPSALRRPGKNGVRK